jgi:hypothetical protein
MPMPRLWSEQSSEQTREVQQQAVLSDESTWEWELSQPYLLRHLGWMVSSDGDVGSGSGSRVLIPELASPHGEAPPAERYARLVVQRRQARLEANPKAGGVQVAHDGQSMVVTRTDPGASSSYALRLCLVRPPGSVHPGAWLLCCESDAPLVGALFDRGVAVGQPRTLSDGADRVRLDGLAGSEGLRVVVASGTCVRVSSPGGRLRAVSGEEVVVVPGGHLQVGSLLYLVEVE